MPTEIIIMGCDIHCYREELIDGKWESPGELEKEYEDEDWLSLRDAEITIRRSYTLFGLLAQVRDFEFENLSHKPKGLPDDVSDDIHTLFQQEIDDAHSESYLTQEELQDTYKKLKVESLLKPQDRDTDWIAQKLKIIFEQFPKTNNKHRIVFWFDC